MSALQEKRRLAVNNDNDRSESQKREVNRDKALIQNELCDIQRLQWIVHQIWVMSQTTERNGLGWPDCPQQMEELVEMEGTVGLQLSTSPSYLDTCEALTIRKIQYCPNSAIVRSLKLWQPYFKPQFCCI